MCSLSSFSTTPPSYPHPATDPVPRYENLKSSKIKESGGEGLQSIKDCYVGALLGNSS